MIYGVFQGFACITVVLCQLDLAVTGLQCLMPTMALKDTYTTLVGCIESSLYCTCCVQNSLFVWGRQRILQEHVSHDTVSKAELAHVKRELGDVSGNDTVKLAVLDDNVPFDLVPDVIHVFKEPPDACTSVVGVEPRTVGSTASGGLRVHIHTDKDTVCKSFVDGVLNALCKVEGDGPFHVV